VQYFGELDPDIRVYRNDTITPDEVFALNPDRIVVSPGPCTPTEAGISVDLIRACDGRIPLLGVCLGHQAIGQAFGGDVVRADRIMHGKTSLIQHTGDSLFDGIESPFIATRYHSLIIKRDTCPAVLKIIAETSEGEIMGVKHQDLPIWGVQFHPESILTESGKRIVANFVGTRAPAASS
jgi:anthranilate synthase/aminodeoxychorismate synthase-like glutamine amidotransferase